MKILSTLFPIPNIKSFYSETLLISFRYDIFLLTILYSFETSNVDIDYITKASTTSTFRAWLPFERFYKQVTRNILYTQRVENMNTINWVYAKHFIQFDESAKRNGIY